MHMIYIMLANIYKTPCIILSSSIRSFISPVLFFYPNTTMLLGLRSPCTTGGRYSAWRNTSARHATDNDKLLGPVQEPRITDGGVTASSEQRALEGTHVLKDEKEHALGGGGGAAAAAGAGAQTQARQYLIK